MTTNHENTVIKTGYKAGQSPGNKSTPHRVVIVGGGFGGLYAAKSLIKAPVDITLIDKRNFHLFQPLLYQVATGDLSPADISSPLRAIFKKIKNCRIINSEVIDIHPEKKLVLLIDGTVAFDSLIIATGSQNHYFGNDWSKSAPGLKSIEDALAIRRRIYEVFEQAEKENDPARQRELLTFVIVGGGPTGVELAGALAELSYKSLKNEFRNFDTGQVSILLIEGTDRILSTYPESLSRKAADDLNGLGVKIMTGTFVTEIENGTVHMKENGSGSVIRAGNIIWAAGVRASGMGEIINNRTGCELDKMGRIKVNPYLSVIDHDNIFIIGDLAGYYHQGDKPLPGLAPVAMAQGRYVARLIKNRLKNKNTSPFRYKDKGNLAVIGRNAAVADFGKVRFKGFLAWLIWVFVHIGYLIEYDNKLIVMIQWAWSYFTRKKGARLITYID